MASRQRPTGPLRIAFDLRRMHKTGIGRYARNLFAAIAADPDAPELVAVVRNEQDASWVREAAPAADWVLDGAEQYSVGEMLRLPALAGPADVFHSPHPYHLGIGGRHRTVLTLLDLIQVTHAIGLRNQIAREPLRAIIWAACKRADRFVAISVTTADLFAERMGVARDRIHVTLLAPDPHFATPVTAEEVDAARARWELGDQVVLYVGMTQPHKNLDRLLQAVALLARDPRSSALQLAIVGPVVPAERAVLEARLRTLGILERVRFLGWLSDDDVRLAYHAAAVLSLPSVAEGFGLTLLEAMQCGTPCVASQLPVLREIAGDAARFVDPMDPASIAEGLHAVLANGGEADRLRTLGRENVRRFSWARAARETIAAYVAASDRAS